MGSDQPQVTNVEGSYKDPIIHVEQSIGRNDGGTVIGVQHITSYIEWADLVAMLKNQDQPMVWNGRNPYLGLSVFQENDAPFFFGRESLVEILLERVQQSNFVVIAGPSGIGKSSVARAGLFHALRNGRLPHSDSWLLATMQPKNDPVAELAAAVTGLAKTPTAGRYIHEQAPTNPNAFHEQIGTLLTDDSRQRCVLLVDQFEEIFTQTKDEAIRTTFINLLTTAAQAEKGRLTIVISLRADFVSNCAHYPDLRRLINQQFQLVGAMDVHDLAKAIMLPSLEVGAEIDPALVSRIIPDMKGEPGALPLMSFALQMLFEQEKTTVGQPMDMTLPEYLEIGGIENALEQHANKIFQIFTVEQEQLARHIFSKLIEVGQGRVNTRRTATLAELVPTGQKDAETLAVIDMLAREEFRLITTSRGTASETTVTIAHEKLIDAWPWLRQLADENREAVRLQNQINNDAQAWAQARDAEFLYRGGRLLHLEERLEELDLHLDALSAAFIAASIEQRRVEEAVVVEQRQRELAEVRRQIAEAQQLAQTRLRFNIVLGSLVVTFTVILVILIFLWL